MGRAVNLGDHRCEAGVTDLLLGAVGGVAGHIGDDAVAGAV
ncbi:unannotated protein [freshwater metagenome]|uniref:Unannotated protein n=1 Tax=freshwater metagenome TaxID=449393 RepID=A0A6J7RTI4_9ZZZZ